MREVHIRCLCTLKVHEKTDLSSGWFLVLGWVWFLGWFLGFFKAMNGFVLVLRCFIGVLGQKQVAKEVFGSKKHRPWFFSHHNGQNLDKTGDTLSVLAWMPGSRHLGLTWLLWKYNFKECNGKVIKWRDRLKN
jgi:hypothetical protein